MKREAEPSERLSPMIVQSFKGTNRGEMDKLLIEFLKYSNPKIH